MIVISDFYTTSLSCFLDLQYKLFSLSRFWMCDSIQAISPQLFFLFVVAVLSLLNSRQFDVRLIPEFIGYKTCQPVVKWIENVELVCELCKFKRIELLQLHLTTGALPAYCQLSKEQKADIEQVNHALLTTFVIDPFMVFNQFSIHSMTLATWQNSGGVSGRTGEAHCTN